jgi:flagellar motor switch protein FliG
LLPSISGSRVKMPLAVLVFSPELRKAAVLLMSLERAQAARLLDALDAHQLGVIAGEIARADDAKPEEFSSVMIDLRAAAESDADLPRPLGERRDEPHVATPVVHPRARFEFLQPLSAQVLATALRHEHPQIVAVVLSHVSAHCAAEIMAALPVELAGSVWRRLATIGPVAGDVVDDVERSLRRRLAARRSAASGN